MNLREEIELVEEKAKLEKHTTKSTQLLVILFQGGLVSKIIEPRKAFRALVLALLHGGGSPSRKAEALEADKGTS